MEPTLDAAEALVHVPAAVTSPGTQQADLHPSQSSTAAEHGDDHADGCEGKQGQIQNSAATTCPAPVGVQNAENRIKMLRLLSKVNTYLLVSLPVPECGRARRYLCACMGSCTLVCPCPCLYLLHECAHT